jgi:AraC-type transcriptional regulator N-terminus
VVAQGRKRANLGGTTFIFDESRYLLTSLDLPVICNVIEASEEIPYLCFVFKLEMPVVRELLSREEIQTPKAPSDNPAMATGETTAELLDACCRLVDLLSTPQDIPFLGGLIQREIIYRILRGPEGALLRSITTFGDQSHRTAKAIREGQDQLREAATRGRTRENRGHGRLHAAPPFPDAHRFESSSVPEATSAACSAGAHAHRSGRCQCRL